jgi:hypothetical protein
MRATSAEQHLSHRFDDDFVRVCVQHVTSRQRSGSRDTRMLVMSTWRQLRRLREIRSSRDRSGLLRRTAAPRNARPIADSRKLRSAPWVAVRDCWGTHVSLMQICQTLMSLLSSTACPADQVRSVTSKPSHLLMILQHLFRRADLLSTRARRKPPPLSTDRAPQSRRPCSAHGGAEDIGMTF